MKLEKLTTEVLMELKLNGYNILTYNNKVSDQSIIWFPEIVENVYDYIVNLCGLGMVVFDEPNILVIDNVLQSPESYSLVGEVLV